MYKLLFMCLVIPALSLSAVAQSGGICDGAEAIFAAGASANGGRTLYAINGTSIDSVGYVSKPVNALGYYNGSAWALKRETNQMVEIGRDGEGLVTSLLQVDITGMPARNYVAGAVRPGTSEYYGFARRYAKLRRIDAADPAAPYANIRATGPVPLPDLGDFAFVSDDEVMGYDKRVGKLVRWNVVTGATDTLAAPELPRKLYAAAYTSGGSLFLYTNGWRAPGDEEVYEVDYRTGAVRSSFAVSFPHRVRQIDAADCPPTSSTCGPVLGLRADVISLALAPGIEADLLADLDVALYNCRRGEYSVTAGALTDFIASVGLYTEAGISLAESELLTNVAQSVISGLPEDNPDPECAPIVDLQGDVGALGLVSSLESALLADLDLALTHCGSGLYADAIDALTSFTGTVTANIGTGIGATDAAGLIAAADAAILGFPSGAQPETGGLRATAKPQAYPNPASGWVTVEAPGTSEGVVYDLAGREVLRFEAPGGYAELDVDGLTPGLYVVRVVGETERHTLKLTVVR